MTGCYEHSQHNCCKFLCQWQHWLSLMKKRLVQAELKHLLSLWSYSTQNFPATRKKGLLLLLWASHAAPTHIITYILLQPSLIHATTPPPPHTPPSACWFPAISNSTRVQLRRLVTPQVFWPVIQKSLHNLVNSLCCCLGKSLPALQPFAFGRFSPRPYGLNASPPHAMKA